MRYDIHHLPKTVERVLCLLYAFPDGVQASDVCAILGISDNQARARLSALVRSSLATYEYEGYNKIWYPYYSADELIELIQEGA